MKTDATIQQAGLQTSRIAKWIQHPTLLLGLVLILGICLRLFQLGAESYWIDEMYTLGEAHQTIPQLLNSGRFDQPLAYYLPLHGWIQIFGSTESSSRAFSALFGVASIAIIYLVGRELFGWKAGLFSALLMAVSAFQIRYSQTARFYSLFEFTGLLSYLFFIIALRTKKPLHFICYAISSILMLHSHAYGVLILAAQNLYFITQWKKVRDCLPIWLTCQVIAVLSLSPFVLPLLLGNRNINSALDSEIGNSLPVPTLLDILRTIDHFLFFPRRDRSWLIVLTTDLLAALILTAGIWFKTVRKGFAGWLATIKSSMPPGSREKLLLLSFWLLCPILLPFLVSLIIKPIYKEYYTISAAPALYLLLAWGFTSLRKVVPLAAVTTALFVLVVPGLIFYYQTPINEQWREAAAFIQTNAEPRDVILFAAHGTGIQQTTFNWYYGGGLAECGLDSALVQPEEITTALESCTHGYSRFWVLIPNYPSEPEVRRYYAYFNNASTSTLALLQERQFVGVSLYLFEHLK